MSEKPTERLWTSKDWKPRATNVEPLSDRDFANLVVKEVKRRKLNESWFDDCKKTLATEINLEIKQKEERRKQAEKELERQREPFYRINLGATCGIFGSFPSSSGYSKDGLKFREELKKYDVNTIKDAINRLKKGDVKGYPLSSYSPEYIRDVIDYLKDEIQLREI